jgi:hypothetical protein
MLKYTVRVLISNTGFCKGLAAIDDRRGRVRASRYYESPNSGGEIVSANLLYKAADESVVMAQVMANPCTPFKPVSQPDLLKLSMLPRCSPKGFRIRVSSIRLGSWKSSTKCLSLGRGNERKRIQSLSVRVFG